MKTFIKYTYQKIFGTSMYKGPYQTWARAKEHAKGYDDRAILIATHQAMEQVKQGRAYIERDGVAILQPKYRDPIMSSFLYIKNKIQRPLRVLDIGGALGSMYYQCKHWLGGEHSLNWTVLEQPHVVEFANKNHKVANLNFISDLNLYSIEPPIDVVMLSSSLQYFDKPYDFIERLMQYRAQYFIYDRIPFSSKNHAKIMLQNAHTPHYKSSYPVWILDEPRLIQQLSQSYKLFAQYNIEEKNIIITPNEFVYFAGALWQHNTT